MRHALLSIGLFFSLFNSASAKFLTLNEIGEASCRIIASDAMGSGTAIAQDKQYIYVLTNAHVVGNSQSVTCEFFRYGRKTSPLAGQVAWRAYSDRRVLDFAVVKIPKSLFGSMPPRVVPLASPTHIVNKDDYIASAGCPQGRWLQLWEGHALSTGSQSRVLFTPPPLGGQSGSGVYTIIKGHTYLTAVLTWRVDENKGGAIHISNFWKAIRGEVNENNFHTIPATWKHAEGEPPAKVQAKKIPSRAVKKKAYYALASNGYHYLQTFKGGIQWKSVIIPNEHSGVKIVQWNVLLEVDCPFGICPPFIPPRNPTPNPPPGNPNSPNPDFPIPNPGDNPDGDPGGNGEGENPFGKVPPNYTPGEIDSRIKDLQARIKELEKIASVLAKEKVDLEDAIQALKQTVSGKLAEIESLKGNAEGNKEKINGLEKEIEDHLSSIGSLNRDLSALNLNLSNKSTEIEKNLLDMENFKNQSKSQVEEVKAQRNLFGWLGGGTGAILLWVFSMYWKLRGKEKMKDIVEDMVAPDAEEAPDDSHAGEKKGAPTEGSVDMAGLLDFLEDKMGSILDSRLNPVLDSVNEKVSSLEQKIERTSFKGIPLPVETPAKKDEASKESVSPDQQEPVLHSEEARIVLGESPEPEKRNCACGDSVLDHLFDNPTFPDVSDRIRQFIDLKSADGERVHELAFYAHLYKEAVSLLKQNLLTVTKDGKEFRVSNQAKAANAVEGYVKNKFLRQISSATINSHFLYHEAMIGFLYKEAIIRLRRGEFNVLGYKDIAQSIDEWVKTEFLKRMGFQF